ncbi:MAG: hypothetical protein B6D59_08080 [Campylobacteraceae bacterium 4484_4]|nr:MAG: hypothetical protein B6D59_08080 [Campylobacteraceae bacterium 4484_4]
MEGRVNYLGVGIFVILFLTGLFGFAFWLMKYGTAESYSRYLVYFDESVAGLSRDAAVKYMGVDIGTVEKMKVNPKNTSVVEVYLKLNHDVTIKEDMRATLKFYGMTGLAYVEITGKDPNSPPLRPKKGETLPVIPSSPSIYARLDETLAHIATKLTGTLEKFETLLSDENLRHFGQTLTHIESITRTLKDKREDIGTLIDRANTLEIRAERVLERIEQTFASFDERFASNLKSTMRELKKLTKNLNTTLKRGDYNLKAIAEPTTRKLNDLIERLGDATSRVEETLEQLQQSPSDLLFKQTPPKKGPGE